MRGADMEKIKNNWKLILVTIGSIFLYTYALACFGLGGPDIQAKALEYGVVCLKYGLLLFGFILFGILPYRISIALKKREKALYDIKAEHTIAEAARRKREVEEKIIKEFVKNEDTI